MNVWHVCYGGVEGAKTEEEAAARELHQADHSPWSANCLLRMTRTASKIVGGVTVP